MSLLQKFHHVVNLIPGVYAPLRTVLVGEAEVTPENAKIILEQFQPRHDDGEVANRKLIQANLMKLHQAMASLGFKFTGEPVIFDDRCRLIDGRHRVTACVNSGVTIPVLVVCGVAPERFELIDQGAIRSAATVFQMAGKAHHQMLAAATATLWGYLRTGIIDRSYSTVGLSNRPAGNQDLVRTLNENPNLEQSTHSARVMRRAYSLIGAGGPMAVAHYMMSLVHPARAESLFTVLNSTDVNLTDIGDDFRSVLMLRTRLMDERAKKIRVNVRQTMALLIKAWNSVSTGRPLKCLKWPAEEAFPEIFGIKYGADGVPILD